MVCNSILECVYSCSMQSASTEFYCCKLSDNYVSSKCVLCGAQYISIVNVVHVCICLVWCMCCCNAIGLMYVVHQ